MMKTYDKKKQTVADIIELQHRMQSIYGIPRSAYGIAQKMYRMGVLSATLPKKLQVLYTNSILDLRIRSKTFYKMSGIAG